jgi:stearoyl-CoA desaturase (delta-9 desaturase)
LTGKTHRYFIITASILPPIGVGVAIVLLWNDLVGWRDLALLAGMYAIAAFGVSAGFHRLLTHRAFKTYKPIRLALATAGTLGAEGPPIIWVSHHRRHHTLSDQEGDPHSPHLHGEEGIRGQLKGFWHAHWGWLFKEELTSDPFVYAPDLVREKEMRWISQHFLGIVVAGIVLPGLIGFAITGGEPLAFVTGVLWGGLVRIFLLHHATYAVNSIGHIAGARRFATSDHSRNVAWLALPSFGEAWHNNHHAFPTSYRHGMRWWEVDLSALFILGLEKLGLAWDVVRISPERERKKLPGGPLAGAPPEPPAAPLDRGESHTERHELAGTAGGRH